MGFPAASSAPKEGEMTTEAGARGSVRSFARLRDRGRFRPGLVRRRGGRALDPFILVVEGSIGNEQINGDGRWTGFGVNPFNGRPITINEWVDRLAPKAAIVVADRRSADVCRG